MGTHGAGSVRMLGSTCSEKKKVANEDTIFFLGEQGHHNFQLELTAFIANLIASTFFAGASHLFFSRQRVKEGQQTFFMNS